MNELLAVGTIAGLITVVALFLAWCARLVE
jgi:hypothetical protein